jgi:hypothetical protein
LLLGADALSIPVYDTEISILFFNSKPCLDPNHSFHACRAFHIPEWEHQQLYGLPKVNEKDPEEIAEKQEKART